MGTYRFKAGVVVIRKEHHIGKIGANEDPCQLHILHSIISIITHGPRHHLMNQGSMGHEKGLSVHPLHEMQGAKDNRLKLIMLGN